MVNLQELTFTPQGSDTPMLGPLNISLPGQGFFAVYGGNGSGKSTLAQLLAGWFPEYLPGQLNGNAQIVDRPLAQHSLIERASSIQLVQQSPQLQLSGCTFTVEEEIAFGPENLSLPAEQIMQRIDEALDYTQSQHLRLRHPATLSGGEAQRIVLACALAMHPRLLLLDEAFSRLTPKATEQLLTQLAAYAEQYRCQIVLFERALFPAARYCSEALLLSQGKQLASGPIETLFDAALASINAPDAWRVIYQLSLQQRWPLAIPLDEVTLINAFKDLYAEV